MTDHTTGAAGAKAPAAGASSGWVDWPDRSDRPLYAVELWPHRALGRSGRAWVIAVAMAGFSMPLAGLAGTPAFWGMLPFVGAVIGVLWWGLRRNDRDGRLRERLEVWQDEIRVERVEPSGRVLRWQAAPYWVRVSLHEEGQKVENYLTLKGGGREIELGAFLSPEERAALKDEVETALSRAR